MNCPKCGKAMREGYLFTSKDGAFSFANTVPGVFENAKNTDAFVDQPILEKRSTAFVKFSMILSASPCSMPSRTPCLMCPSNTILPQPCKADFAGNGLQL